MQPKVATGTIATWVRTVPTGIVEEMRYLRTGATWFRRRDGRLTRMVEYHGMSVEQVHAVVAEYGFVRGVSLAGMRPLG